MVEAVRGFGEHDMDAWLWGEWHGDGRVGDKTTERPRSLGAATSIIGNAVSVEDEEHKLRTIVETAQKVWG
ncbi:MAG: hypothetical protein M3317_16635 [Actinomycetota bacterium]|nr:hypothetical protein [Actinomycetota bacterium]